LNVDRFFKGWTAAIEENVDGGYLVKYDANGREQGRAKIWEKEAETKPPEKPKDIVFHRDMNVNIDQKLNITWNGPPNNNTVSLPSGIRWTGIANSLNTSESLTKLFVEGHIAENTLVTITTATGIKETKTLTITNPLLAKLKDAKGVYDALSAHGGIANVDTVLGNKAIKLKSGTVIIVPRSLPSPTKTELEAIISALR
jgi:hypothetical protein